MPKRKTHEQFMNELSKVNINIEVLGAYVNTHTKLQCRCLIDGYEWNISPHDLLAGFGCPKCGGTLKKTHDDFKSELEQINPNIILLNKYIDMKHKVKCKCLIDGNEWESLPQNLLNGHGCPKCSAQEASKRNLKSHETFLHDVHMVSPTIVIQNIYKNNTSKIKCKCEICANEWTTTASNLVAGKGCPKCGLEKRISAITKNHKQFIDEMLLANSDIEIIGKYINSSTPIKCKCLNDGYIWEATPSNLLKGTGCPVCSNSHGEKAISTVLDSMSIEYIPQHRFNDCRNTRSLPFDFYLPHFNMCIEYDGQQHFRPVNFGGCTDEQAIKSFESTKLNDSIKNQYCKNNNIRLLRISYCDYDNIGTIIQNIF